MSLHGLKRWDAIHFLHIAQHGYVFEHSAAFFPLYPLLIRLVATRLFNSADPRVYLLSSVLLNFIFFNAACVYLHALTLKLFKRSSRMATLTCLLFCLNPANIFFTAPYSESLYSMLTFAGLYHTFSGSVYRSLIPFGLACLCRSNGTLNVGYLVHLLVRDYLNTFNIKPNQSNMSILTQIFKESMGNIRRLLALSARLFLAIMTMTMSFAAYQYYIYIQFCGGTHSNRIPVEIVEYGRLKGYKLASEGSFEWCQYRLPVSYGYVQAHYWHVGFMTYWTLRQLPNFLLALPLYVVAFSALKTYFASMGSANNCFNWLGLLGTRPHSIPCPFAVHLIALMTSGLFFMHVQVRRGHKLILFKSLKIVCPRCPQDLYFRRIRLFTGMWRSSWCRTANTTRF